MKHFLFVLLATCLIVGCVKNQEIQPPLLDPPPPPESLLHEVKGLFNGGFVDIVYFKTHPNDIQRALVSGFGHMYRNDARWYHFIYENGQWHFGTDKMDKNLIAECSVLEIDSSIDPRNYIETHGEGFYYLIEEGQAPKFLIVQIWFRSTGTSGKRGDEAKCQEAYHVFIDDEGYLKIIPLPEYTMMDVEFDFFEPEEEDLFPIIKFKSPNDKLEKIPLLTFVPDKDGNFVEKDVWLLNTYGGGVGHSETTVFPLVEESANAHVVRMEYTVQEGEDIFDVAFKFSVLPITLREINNITGHALTPGRIIKIPEPGN